MHFAYLSLLTAALLLIQCMLGGTRLADGLPAYALLGLAGALSYVSLRKSTVKPSRFCLGSTLLLAGYVLLRAFCSPNAYLAQADAYLAVGCLLVYLLTALYLPQTLYRNSIVGALFLVALVHMGVGALQFTDGSNFMLFGFSRNAAYGVRASGMLSNPNALAGFLETVAFLALGVACWGRWNLPAKFAAGYLALFCFVGVAITGSRGAYLSSLVGLLVFAGLSLGVVRIFHRRRLVATFLGMAVGAGLMLGAGVCLMHTSLFLDQRLRQISPASKDVRWYGWLATADQFKTHPVLGTGAGTHFYYGRLYRRPQLQVVREHPLNDYLELLAEYGIVGGGLAAFFLFTHIARGLALARQVARRRLSNIPGLGRSHTLALLLGSLGALAALLAHSVVDSNMHVPGNAMLMAFLCAILGSGGLERDSEEGAERLEVFSRKALVAAGAGLLLACALRYPAERLSDQARQALESRDFAECNRLAGLAIQKSASNPEAHFYQGEACRALAASSTEETRRQTYLQAATAAYRNALEHFPQNATLWVGLGQCLDATAQFTEAQEAYLRAIAADPNLGILYACYGAHLRLVGDLAGAERCESAGRKLGELGVEKTGLGEPASLLNASLSTGKKAKEPEAL